MYRFYLKWNGQDYTVINETHGIIGKTWRRTQCRNITTPFIELVGRKTKSGLEITFIPMETDSISGAAIHAANDNNERELLKRDEKKNDMYEFKQKLQGLIDMSCEYGVEFMEDFNTMLEQMKEKYPVEKIQLKKTTRIIG